jgi:hypothetical protein
VKPSVLALRRTCNGQPGLKFDIDCMPKAQ